MLYVQSQLENDGYTPRQDLLTRGADEIIKKEYGPWIQ